MTRKRLCLAASGGGHVRQLLDLRSFWQEHDHFFVTEPTALGDSIAAEQTTFFVDHFAWGQGRLGKWGAMLRSAAANLVQSARIIGRERPDIIITTGAGSMAPLVLFGRLRGAHVILIDSFARFDAPSLFARLMGRFAHVRIAQSPISGAKWPGALIFDPFVRLDTPRPPKRAMLFATVGATLAFPRLIDWVTRAHQDQLLPPEVIVQTGIGTDPIPGLDCHETLPFDRIGAILRDADVVICHGGTGSIITALQQGCHVIVIPREHVRGEHYDDHQTEIALAFAGRGLLQVALDYAGFVAALQNTVTRTPQLATTDPQALAAWLKDHIAALG